MLFRSVGGEGDRCLVCLFSVQCSGRRGVELTGALSPSQQTDGSASAGTWQGGAEPAVVLASSLMMIQGSSGRSERLRNPRDEGAQPWKEWDLCSPLLTSGARREMCWSHTSFGSKRLAIVNLNINMEYRFASSIPDFQKRQKYSKPHFQEHRKYLYVGKPDLQNHSKDLYASLDILHSVGL